MIKVELLKSKNNEFYWRIFAGNGRELCRSSETYKTRRPCVKSIKRVLQDSYITKGVEEDEVS